MGKKIKFADRLIGEGTPCFIVAEAGVNHNGDANLAKKLIDLAKKAGADAVKFQTFRAEDIVTKSAEKAEYQKETTGTQESQYEMIKRLELSEKDFVELHAYAQSKEIIFISTPFDQKSVDLLSRLDVPAFKVSSGEITNIPLLKYIAKKKKPVILSTGMATLKEIGEALKIIQQETKNIILLHCVSSYPARIEDMNLKVMDTLRQAFKLPVGLSDHTVGISIPIAAVALGACVIEKHFTLDKSLPGPDHRASLEPHELEQMIKAIRDVEKAIGNGRKTLAAEEKKNKKVARRSLVARVDIPKGTVITEEMLDLKRPGVGIEPKYMSTVIGRKTRESIRHDELIAFAKLR
jgi:N-acetylneuraminate synthase/N,N'-diacetyllegionaminate synthase